MREDLIRSFYLTHFSKLFQLATLKGEYYKDDFVLEILRIQK